MTISVDTPDEPATPATSSATERGHTRDIVTQIDTLRQRGAADVDAALREVNKTSVVSVPGAMYAGVTVVDEAGTVATVGATHLHPQVLDGIQVDTGEGPCLAAARSGQTIRVDDLAAETRWPTFRDVALGVTPVRSVLSFALFDDGKRSGALNFYAPTAGVFDQHSVELGRVYAAHTTLAWNLLHREHQFRSALASRDAIGQAKGMLIERFHIDGTAAFELLRQLSQETNTKLTDIADRLIQRGWD